MEADKRQCVTEPSALILAVAAERSQPSQIPLRPPQLYETRLAPDGKWWRGRRRHRVRIFLDLDPVYYDIINLGRGLPADLLLYHWCPMRLVRSNLKFGSWCALFAFAIQILVPFNHVHRIDSISPSPLAFRIGRLAPSNFSLPSKPVAPEREYCTLCAAINLAGNALPADAPAPSRAVIVSSVQFRAQPSFVAAASPRRHFSARAPPQA